MKFRVSVMAAVLVFGAGCTRKEKADSTTAGSSTIVVTNEYLPFVSAEAEKFASVYPDVKLKVTGTTTREAVVALANGQAPTICIDRRLNEEEQRVVRTAEMPVSETVIALDALALIVHSKNTVREMSNKVLKDIVTGSITTWERVPGATVKGPIEFDLTGKNSGTYELLQRSFFPTAKELAVTNRSESSSASVEFVSTHTGAMSFVSLIGSPLANEAVRVVALEADTSWKESAYVRPSQMDVYRKAYPLRYEVVLVNAEKRAGVGAGLGSFMLATAGQRIVQNVGLVPAHVPYHAIQLTSE